ncbi:MAG: hypothetical protein KBS55_01460 [Bacteroidales bacterium]|nr:hypothetical protein [Candidatus Cryptobacteroides aphodequi]
MPENTYNWQYASVGGVVRVKITSGEDIAHLGELDQTKWTVLSCPTQSLEFEPKTLQLIDTDGDGKIRVCEIVAAAQWLTSVVKDKDSILAGNCTIKLSNINTECPEGQSLYNSAKQILANLGAEGEELSLAQATDSVAIFAQTRFNGDGIITEASAADDAALAKVIADATACMGGTTDRSGAQGIDAAGIEAFYAALADYSAWCAARTAEILPYGENTEAALAACKAVEAKVADYFMRCKLVAFNGDAAGAVDVSVAKIGEIAERDLSTCGAEISAYPIARPNAEGVLPFKGVNPAWKAAIDAVAALEPFAGKEGMTEAEWNAFAASFGAYEAWKAAKAGCAVEGLGLDAVNALLAADQKAALLDLVAQDKALEAESAAIDAVAKLMYLYRDFARLLRNYVVFSDFYGRNEDVHAVFEAGKLYIDERCCNLCIKVSGSGNHAEAASLGGMFLIYCTCTSKKLGKTQDILAVMTDGGIKNLRPGKNAIFYDLEGNDWDAVVTKIVDNPISIKQAFWAPYRKLGNFITDKINKSAAEKDNAATANLIASADKPGAAAEKKSAFDIAKFAGIFAAIGMALGMIGSALVSLAHGISTSPTSIGIVNLIIVLVSIMLVISGPSCFIAWTKLRKRNLGPVLNANGWAINSSVLINIVFGGTLTSIAKYPIVKGGDPFKKKGTPCWKKWLWGIIAAVVVAFGVLFFTDNLGWAGIHRHKAAEPECVEAVSEPAAEVADDAAVVAE